MKYDYKIPIFKYSLNDWESKKIEILELLKTKINNPEKYRQDYRDQLEMSYGLKDQPTTEVETDFYEGYTQKWENTPHYKGDIIELLYPELRKLVEDSGIPARYDATAMWYERAKKTEVHGVHDHGAKGISAVLYVELNDNQKGTQFYPEWGEDFTLDLDVKEGDIIFFPCWLKHAGSMNTDDEIRTIVSFNMIRIRPEEDEWEQSDSDYQHFTVHV